MANSLDTTKSALGRLLASENIRVEHKQVNGPSFDVKARVLTLPIWKNVDSDLYDLMIGHEVGHALYTPADGWMDEVKALGKSFKSMLNLVEDARIERKMKRKYPGLTRPMYNGYTTLVDRGFFGVTIDEMASLPFADRLNVYFKLGVRSGVQFNEKEQSLVDRIEVAESFEEVISLAKELHAVASSEASDLEDFFDSLPDDFDPEAQGEGEEMEGDGEVMTSEQFKQGIQRLRDAGRHELADRLEQASDRVMSKLQEQNSKDPSSSTQEALDAAQDKLIDGSAYPNEYVTMPDLDPREYVIPSAITYSMMKFGDNTLNKKETLYSDFMRTTKRYVNYLVREFELNRNASQFAKAKTYKTGKLDVDKVWKYRLSENLFLTNTVVPNGKNHGMLMVVDLSSSMCNNIPGTIEQLISLVMFCRKVNIPFDVYGFTDASYWMEEYAKVGVQYTYDRESRYQDNRKNNWQHNDLIIKNPSFRLKQFFHSGMTTPEFNEAVKNMLMVADVYKSAYSRSFYVSHQHIPAGMDLGGTPLNEAILVLRKIADDFKKAYKIEVLNTIILTDGDASYRLGVHKVATPDADTENTHRVNYVIENKKTRHQVRVTERHGSGWTKALLEMYKHMTGSRVIGFYLFNGNPKNNIYRYAVQEPDFEHTDFVLQYQEEYAKNKYFGLRTKGYDIFFMISGDELEVEEVTMDTTMKSAKTLFTAFKRMQTTKQISRVFLNSFIKQVA